MQETVTLETTLGNIEIELFRDKAPISVENFLGYVNGGFYDGTIIHRVIDNFVIQAGGIEEDMGQRAARQPITNEADNGLKNELYTVAMGRDEAIDSATSHFYINLKHNKHLDHSTESFGYAVFGRVISGFDTVDRLRSVETTTGILDGEEYPGLPAKQITILRAYAN